MIFYFLLDCAIPIYMYICEENGDAYLSISYTSQTNLIEKSSIAFPPEYNPHSSHKRPRGHVGIVSLYVDVHLLSSDIACSDTSILTLLLDKENHTVPRLV